MRSAKFALLTALVASLVACSSAGTGSAARGDRNLVTTEELRQAVSSNVYEFVQSSRPMWLRRRGQTSINNEGDIVVYLDGNRLGGPDALRSISPTHVERMQFLDAPAAQQRFGVGHSHGAILVFTRQR